LGTGDFVEINRARPLSDIPAHCHPTVNSIGLDTELVVHEIATSRPIFSEASATATDVHTHVRPAESLTRRSDIGAPATMCDCIAPLEDTLEAGHFGA
jgi:hypothetical protein